MGQFCAYQNPNPATRSQYPYLLDIQSDLLSGLRTTLVVPMTPTTIAAPISLSRLNPTFRVNGESYTAMTQDVAGIDRKHLGAMAFDLSEHRTEIIAAIDFVVSGI